MPDDCLPASSHAVTPVLPHMAAAARSINVVEVIDEAKVGRLEILILTLCALVAILDGFDLQAIAFIGPVIGGVLASLRLDIQGYFLIFGLLLMVAAIAIALLQFDDKPAVQPGGKPVNVVG